MGHSRQPATLHSAVVSQAMPTPFCGEQTPRLVQYAFGAQPESSRQVVGHAVLPPHTNGLHAGLPSAPAATVAHVPFVVAPSATEHAWHWPLHALSQQNPSTHG